MGWDDRWDDEFESMFDPEPQEDEFVPKDPRDTRFLDRPQGSLVVFGSIKYNATGNPVETEKAVLWTTKDGSDHWIPKSQIHQRDDSDHLVISGWLADQKGWLQSEINQEQKIPLSDWDDDDIPF